MLPLKVLVPAKMDVAFQSVLQKQHSEIKRINIFLQVYTFTNDIDLCYSSMQKFKERGFELDIVLVKTRNEHLLLVLL